MRKRHLLWVVASTMGLALLASCGGSTSGENERVPAAPREPGEPSYTSAPIIALQDAVIPADRRTVWNPGVTYGGGGIPNRQDVCNTLTPLGGDNDGTPAIQAALDECPDGQVVVLAAGTFNINGPGLAIQRSNITLRGSGTGEPGSGAGGSRLVKADGETNRNDAILYVGNNPAEFADTVDLAEDAIKGTNTIIVAENPGLAAGEYVLIDHVTNNDPVVEWREQHEGLEEALADGSRGKIVR